LRLRITLGLKASKFAYMMSRYLFITGKLAAKSLCNTLDSIPNLKYKLATLPISVAALMNTRFIAKHISGAMGCGIAMIPGSCKGDLNLIADKLGIEVVRGPVSLKDIPVFFGTAGPLKGYGAYKMKIIAEIVDAHQIGLDQILARASYFRDSGADIIDLGCPVEAGFPEIGKAVKALKEAGFQVSVDSFNPADLLKADQAGVDLVLSINSENLELARRLHCKVVVIPDFNCGLESLERNIVQLDAWHIPYIIDPILHPIGFGFAESIGNYIAVRRNHPNCEMLMGLGNLTELTDADTTGINAVMAGFIAELGIDYALTTEVISWARGAVRELDLARRIMYYAHEHKVLPKHLNDGLITIKDPPFESFTEEELRAIQSKVRDRNFRIYTDQSSIFVFNRDLFVKGSDIQELFEQLNGIDVPQAFYLGKELQKALLAIHLGKKYVQEEDLRWGYLKH
jgi:dihydropteroate synthase-like protein